MSVQKLKHFFNCLSVSRDSRVAMRERITNTRARISAMRKAAHPTPIHTRFFAQHARRSFFFCSFTPFFTATGRDFLSNNGQSIHQPIATTPLSIRTRPCSKHSFPHFSVVNAGRSTPSPPLSTLTLQHHLTVIALHTTQTPVTNTHFRQLGTVYSSTLLQTQTLNHRVTTLLEAQIAQLHHLQTLQVLQHQIHLSETPTAQRDRLQ